MSTLSLKQPSKRFKDPKHNQRQQNERKRMVKLATSWLKSFPVFQKPMLLKIGIHHDLREIYSRGEYEFGTSHIRTAIRFHTKSKTYQALAIEGTRYDLAGNPIKLENSE